MPIAINGSGTISGISVGGLENGCVNEADLASAAVSNAKLAANSVTIDKLGTNEQSQLCKAWVNFAGDGTVAIRASYNVSSITDNGVGDYRVNFATALADGFYAACVNSGNSTGAGQGSWTVAWSVASSTASNLRVGAFSLGGSYQDQDQVMIAIFR